MGHCPLVFSNVAKKSTHLNGGLDLSAVGGILCGDGDGEQEAGAGGEGAVAEEEGGGLRDGAHLARRLEAAPVMMQVRVVSSLREGSKKGRSEVGTFLEVETFS